MTLSWGFFFCAAHARRPPLPVRTSHLAGAALALQSPAAAYSFSMGHGDLKLHGKCLTHSATSSASSIRVTKHDNYIRGHHRLGFLLSADSEMTAKSLK